MAKINISFDTETKKSEITINGVAYNDVENVYLDNYGDYGYIELIRKPTEKDGITTLTRIIASDKTKVDSSKFDGKIEIEEFDNDLIDDQIRAWARGFFSKK